jgi:hypothetical protein
MTMKQPHRVAAIVVFVVDASYALWGAMAAALPDLLPGPRGMPILRAGYEGFTGSSWAELAAASPLTAGYMEILFRVYGMHCLAFGLLASAIALTAFRRGEAWAWWALFVGNSIAFASAMTYDWIANAIGPFELSEYLGILLAYAALFLTAPFLAPRHPLHA